MINEQWMTDRKHQLAIVSWEVDKLPFLQGEELQAALTRASDFCLDLAAALLSEGDKEIAKKRKAAEQNILPLAPPEQGPAPETLREIYDRTVKFLMLRPAGNG